MQEVYDGDGVAKVLARVARYSFTARATSQW